MDSSLRKPGHIFNLIEAVYVITFCNRQRGVVVFILPSFTMPAGGEQPKG